MKAFIANLLRKFGPKSGFELFEFYATFGHGHRGFPGYVRVKVYAESWDAAESRAFARVNYAVGDKWCRLYSDITEVHESDRIHRGDV